MTALDLSESLREMGADKAAGLVVKMGQMIEANAENAKRITDEADARVKVLEERLAQAMKREQDHKARTAELEREIRQHEAEAKTLHATIERMQEHPAVKARRAQELKAQIASLVSEHAKVCEGEGRLIVQVEQKPDSKVKPESK